MVADTARELIELLGDDETAWALIALLATALATRAGRPRKKPKTKI